MSTETYEFQSEFMSSYKAQWREEVRAEVLAEGLAEGRAEGRAQGLASGEARAVLLVLETRKVELSDAARARISDCTDLDQLERWLRRAAVVDSAAELFDESEG
jgi:flagellar biosynthesis/type III secretory pathway protein FliH